MKKILLKILSLTLAILTFITSFHFNVYANIPKDLEKQTNEKSLASDDSFNKKWDGNQKQSIYNGDGFKVIFTLSSTWDEAHNANVRIENTGDTVIDNWHIRFPLDNEITSVWNAKIQSIDGNIYTFKNDRWNQDIPINGSVEFGYEAEGEFSGFPTSYELLFGKMIDVPDEDVEIEYDVVSDWCIGFNAEITIRNNSDYDIEDWVMEFDMDNQISHIWNALIEEYDGVKYVLKSPDYAQNIDAGESFTFGFTVHHGNSENEPINIKLKQMVTDIEDIPEDDDEKVDIKIDEKSFIKLEGYENNFVSDKTNKIFGKLLGASNVSDLTYKIISGTGEEISTGTIEKEKDWSFSNFNFGYGENDIIVTAKDKQGNIHEDKAKVYSLKLNNINDLLSSSHESDYMLKNDTDGDGLSDFAEIEILNTNPFKVDTDDDGIWDGDEDIDEDGLPNLQEISTSLNPVSNDTDGDGLFDGDEIYKHRTNPFSQDSDNDTATDKWELDNGFNPSVYDSSFNITKTIEVDDKIKHLSVEIEGVPGKVAETFTIEDIDDALLNENIPGYISTAHDFSTEGDIKSAKLSYTLDNNLFTDKNFEPALYYFNEENQLLELVQGQKLQGNVLTAELEHFSKYIILNKKIFEKIWEYEIQHDTDNNKYSGIKLVFLIDSSGSMSGNDSKDVRKKVTHDFIDKLTKTDMAAVVDFDDSANVFERFTSDKSKLHQAVDKIDSSGGTNIGVAVKTAIDLFKSVDSESKNHAKSIILLTDGDGYYNTEYTKQAKDAGIKIYTVGLGSQVSERLLKDIANGTDGSYFHASNAHKLYDIFKKIADTTDLYKDSDGDGISDYYEKEMNNGNLRLGTGLQLIGMDYLNKDSDGDGLLDGEEIKVVTKDLSKTTSLESENKATAITVANKKKIKTIVNAKSNPTKKDSDRDGLPDSKKDTTIGGKTILPKDPNPLVPNGPLGIWQKQKQEVLAGNVATTLKPEYEFEASFSKFLMYKLEFEEYIRRYGKGLRLLVNLHDSNAAQETGSRILRFKRDDKNMAVHSQVETWQKFWGYNDIYDFCYRIGVLGNMRRAKFEFSVNSKNDHIVWIWRGDYLNLGAGAEIGMYNNPKPISYKINNFKDKKLQEIAEKQKSEIVDYIKENFPDAPNVCPLNMTHWDAIPFNLPMELSLFNYTNKNRIDTDKNIDTLFVWQPTEEQWWITGFNPNIDRPKSENLVMVGSIDFKGREHLFNALKSDTISKNTLKDFMIFDDDEKKVWIIWWDKK